MDKNYYKEYYTLERNHWWFKVRAKIIILLIDKSIKKLPQNTNLQVLNAGAAIGRTSEILGKYGTVTSLEYDKDCCDFAKENLNMDITHGNILALPYADNSFDVVCAFDVIEHVEDDKLAISEMKRVCKGGGLLVVTVPAYMLLWSHHDVVNQHFRRYTKRNIFKLFSNNTLDVNFATYYNSILFFPILLFRLLTKLIPQRWIRNGAGSDATLTNENGLANSFLYRIFNLELGYLKFLKFPFGVSIFAAAIKNK
jgi:SAM-dependent methyltransferase